MTSTSNVGRVARIARTAATTYAKGSAGVGLVLAQRGYRLAHDEAARRRAAAKAKPARSPRVSVRTRRLVVFGGITAVVAGIAVTAMRRRSVVAPPADAPPSLADYSDASDTAGERVNGSAPAQTP